ncbi:hypothetical protein Gogos_001087 [Gossypium gossypioides]|uniref:RNase H type-1 domain-containing protein n=1 Tax=Gossypium gossypioides TaxID=34282 RepID=A0A7J9CUV5_GOSGO|nr:hypothetical protein [Gossypium gossypioides]
MIADSRCIRCHDYNESNTYLVRDCCLAKQIADEVVTFISGFSMEYLELSSNLQHPKPRGMICWNPPPSGWVKFQVNSVFSTARQKAISGFIIRDEEGNIMGSGFRIHHLVRTVALAKATALLLDVQFASRMGFKYVIAESSRMVINNINSNEEDYSKPRLLTWDLKASTRNFSECHFQFVARKGKSIVHAMTEEGLRRLEDYFWVEDAPMKAFDLAASDHRSHWPP